MSNLDSQIALASQSIAQIRHKTKGPIDYSSLIPPYHEEGSLRYHDGDDGENISCKVKLAVFQPLLQLFQLTSFVLCKRTLLQLNSLEPYPSWKQEKERSFVTVRSRLPKMWNFFLGLVISRRSRTVTAKKCAKKCAARAELLFYIKFSYRPFTACHSRGTKPPCWDAKVALGQDQPKAYIIFVCPSATFASQHGDFVSGEWQAAKGLLPMRRSCWHRRCSQLRHCGHISWQ